MRQRLETTLYVLALVSTVGFLGTALATIFFPGLTHLEMGGTTIDLPGNLFGLMFLTTAFFKFGWWPVRFPDVG